LPGTQPIPAANVNKARARLPRLSNNGKLFGNAETTPQSSRFEDLGG